MPTKSANKSATIQAVLGEMLESALRGRALAFKESFDKVMKGKASKLIKEEKSRVATMMFSGHNQPKVLRESTEDGQEDAAAIYNTAYVTDPQLFEKEKPHMPEDLQKATADGVSIDPLKEKEAIDLTTKFHSIEIADA